MTILQIAKIETCDVGDMGMAACEFSVRLDSYQLFYLGDTTALLVHAADFFRPSHGVEKCKRLLT
jgi:hypothetical protein